MPELNLAQKYNKFQNDFGSRVEQNYEELIESLFAPELTKTANGQVLAADRSKLHDQLSSIREMVDSWNIEVKYIMPSAEDHKYVVRYLLTTDHSGTFDVMTLLGSSDGIKIDLIDEVYYVV